MGQHIVTNRVVSHILLRAKSNNGPVASLLIGRTRATTTKKGDMFARLTQRSR
jgi:hypothetical protein